MLEFERERLAKRNKEDSDKRQLHLFENEIGIANFKKRRFFIHVPVFPSCAGNAVPVCLETGLFIKV